MLHQAAFATVLALALVPVASLAQAVPPAPQVTAGAGIKHLQFDWDPVPGANYYELWHRPSAAGRWLRILQRPAGSTTARIAVSVHLLDWVNVRYRVDACNLYGCTPSTPVAVTDLRREAVGYFKPPVPLVQGNFGRAVALSADGRTMAVGNGETERGNDFPEPNAFIIYLYRRVGSAWVLDQRLVPQPAEHATWEGYGKTLALNGNGTVLVLGNWAEGEQDVSNRRRTGAVHVYRRAAGGWQLEQKLTIPDGTLQQDTMYGMAIDVDDSGETLGLTRYMVDDIAQIGHAHIFKRGPAGWQQAAELPVYYWELGRSRSCGDIALSGDGRTFARRCVRPPSEEFQPSLSVVQVFVAPAWELATEIVLDEAGDDFPMGSVDLDLDGTLLVARSISGGVVYRHTTGNEWVPDGVLPGSALAHGGGTSMAMSRNGKWIAMSDANNAAVRIYGRQTAGWKFLRTIHSNTPAWQAFGHPVALGDNGSILAVGAADDPSAATGIDGDQADTSAPSRGAVWIY
jgi:hypothetical protein